MARGSSFFFLAIAASASIHAQQQGTVTYIYTDPQGTPLAEADVQGNITKTFDYTPYGTSAMGTSPNGPGYTGHVNDPETNLIYMQHRYYDPATGRFLSVDPVATKAADVYGMDRYGYASSNPTRYVDPDGRYACGSSDKGTCARIEKFVGAMNKALGNLKKGSDQYNRLSAVSAHIGKLGDNNGVTLSAGSLLTGVIAQADSATTMTVDVHQASTLSAPFRAYNPGVSSKQLADDFGGSAVAHEGQHQLDYQTSGYPTGRKSEHNTEMNAYQTELGVAMGLGISTDLYAPRALQKDIDARVNEAADLSTEVWCKSNGC